jgi:hypothetical protein
MPTPRPRGVKSTEVSRSKRLKSSDKDAIKKIRALFIVVYNDERSLLPQAVELFHVIGSILEGTPLRHIDCHVIDKEAVLRELKEQGDIA